MLIYVRSLGGLPERLVEGAVLKTIQEWSYGSVPPVAVVLRNAESLNGSVNAKARVKTWEEAWGEIEKAMMSTPWGKVPAWSTPQIAAAVSSFGWSNLQTIQADDFNTARAQVRRFYEDACSRIKDQARNEYLLGKNPQGILGIPAVAEVVKKLEGAK